MLLEPEQFASLPIVEAVFHGRELYLQVLAYAPKDEEPGLKFDATLRRPRG